MSARNKVLERLARFRRRLKWIQLQVAWSRLLVFPPLALLALLLVEHTGSHAPAQRETLRLLAIGLGLAWAALMLALPLVLFFLKRHTPDDEELARRLGWGSTEIRDRLLNALQVLRQGKENRQGVDPELIRAGLDHIALDLERHDDRRSLPRRERNRGVLQGLGLCLLLLVVLAAGGEDRERAWLRLSDPAGDYSPPPPFRLRMAMDRDSLVLGESVMVEVRAEGQDLPQEVELLLHAGEERRSRRLALHRGVARLDELSPAEDMRLSARAGVIHSDTLSLSVRIPPMLESFRLRARPPYYTGLPARELPPGLGDLLCPVGSLVRLSGRLNKPVTEGQLVLSGESGETVIQIGDSLGVEGDSLAFRVHFRARRDAEWSLQFRDEQGLALAGALPGRLRVIQDQPPRLSVIEPLEPVGRLSRDLNQPLVAIAEDDYGIHSLRLVYDIRSALLPSEGGEVDPSQLREPPPGWKLQDLPFTALTPQRGALDELWTLAGEDLLPDDRIHFYLEVFDNDGWNGRKSTRSSLYTLKVPGMEELYAEVEQDQEQLVAEAEEIMEESRRNHEELRELAQELKRDPELKWEQQQKLKQLAQRHEELAEQAEETAEKLEEMQQKMELNNLISEEMKQKFERLTDLLREAMDPELMEKMRQAAEQAQQANQPEQTDERNRAMRDMEEMVRSMERQMEQFLSVLEEMRIQQKLEEFGRRLAEMADRQEQIGQDMASTRPERLARDEERLEEDYRQLEEEFQAFREEYADRSSLPREQLAQAAETMQQEQPGKQMETLAGDLQEGQTGESSQQKSQELERDLEQLAAQMNSASQQAAQNAKEEMAREIDRICQELLVLSLSQEDVNHANRNLSRQSARLSRLAEQSLENRMGIQACANAVEQLAQRSFHIPREVLGMLAGASNSLQEMLEDYHERQLGGLRSKGPGVLGAVNTSILKLKESKQQMQNSSSSSGFEEMMQQLAQASSQQQSLNSQCDKLMSDGQGQGGQKPMSISFGEAASRQAEIRQQMESLAESLGQGGGSRGSSSSSSEGEGEGEGESGEKGENGGQGGEGEEQGESGGQKPDGSQGQGPLGDMGQIASDMREVEKDLENQLITERTRRLQERILTRLLEAQQSVRRQDLSPERKSRSADPLRAERPGALPEQREEQLQRNLLRAMQEGYSPESEELIRDYFRALEELRSSETGMP